MALCGGVGEEQPVEGDALEILNGVRAQAEEKAGAPFPKWEPKSMQTQVVAGINYIFKVLVDEGNLTATIKVFAPLPHTGEQPSITEFDLKPE